jgi:ubiquinone/menaquinone biosynthesis C-methylase UbiE
MIQVHKYIHKKVTLLNRIKVLSNEISKLIEKKSTVLDVGSGSGDIAFLIEQNTDSTFNGIDILVREDTKIPVKAFDGKSIPFADKSCDYVIFMDVLHHTSNVKELLIEAIRVAKKGVIIKDHNCNNSWQNKVLRFTDWFGNAQYGVSLEYNFISRKNWISLFNELGLTETIYMNPKLYPTFTKLIFWKDLDFISKLTVNDTN